MKKVFHVLWKKISSKLMKYKNKNMLILIISVILYMLTTASLIIGFDNDSVWFLIYTIDIIWFTLLTVANCRTEK